MSGALLLAPVAGRHATGAVPFEAVSAAAILLAWTLKTPCWRDQPVDRLAGASGLEGLGRTRVLLAQDGASTFVHCEMLRDLPAERARVLRLAVQGLLFALPPALTAFAIAGPASAAAPAVLRRGAPRFPCVHPLTETVPTGRPARQRDPPCARSAIRRTAASSASTSSAVL